ncbi:Hypothetical protein CAP_7813 [Chondromyces apiculatus DSM 436]|uniref:Uncharacterized protein n=1 Tax=Chondromyces apiculatus DSM 436 TaxID=1192034 RepID=A0A017SY95_9BACT|nr:Hypothetical protein CAP_7813 [Chondromyces apiculatus DSM 436]
MVGRFEDLEDLDQRPDLDSEAGLFVHLAHNGVGKSLTGFDAAARE